MAKAHETSGKKEIAKRKVQKRKEKEEKKERRQAQSDKGKGLEAMMAYIDENGNLTDTPPDPKKKKEIRSEDISLGAAAIIRDEEDENGEKEGVVTFFNNAKGFGFIKETKGQNSYFVHINNLSEPIGENDRVVFQVAKGQKGMHATMVRRKK